MVFDFLGDKKKVVIAMAHIGALPGSPLYDADGGVNKLIEGVLKDIDALQAGGVDAVMFGNENDRPYVLKAPPEGVAANDRRRPSGQAASQGRRSASIISGIRSPAWPLRPRRARASCARSSPASSLPTWVSGRPIAPAPSACAAISAART